MHVKLWQHYMHIYAYIRYHLIFQFQCFYITHSLTHTHSHTPPKVTSPVRIPSEKQVKRANIYSVKPRLQLPSWRPGGEERGERRRLQSSLGWAVMRYPPPPHTHRFLLFWLRCTPASSVANTCRNYLTEPI